MDSREYCMKVIQQRCLWFFELWSCSNIVLQYGVFICLRNL